MRVPVPLTTCPCGFFSSFGFGGSCELALITSIMWLIRFATPDAQRPTPNAQRPTPNAIRPTSQSEHLYDWVGEAREAARVVGKPCSMMKLMFTGCKGF